MGDRSLPKERIEIFTNKSVAIIDDFRCLSLYNRGKIKNLRLVAQDKGHENELKSFVAAVLNGGKPPIEYEEIVRATNIAFDIIDSLNSGSIIKSN